MEPTQNDPIEAIQILMLVMDPITQTIVAGLYPEPRSMVN